MLQSNGAGAAPTWVTAFSGTGFTAGTGLSISGTTLNSYWTLNGSNNLYNNNSGTFVGINTASPVNVLDVNGGEAIGTYAGVNTSPSNGLIVSGDVSLGTSASKNELDVNGGTAIGSYAGSNTAPSNSLIVSGSISSGTTSPAADAGLAISNGHLESQQTTAPVAALNSGGCLGTPAKAASFTIATATDVGGTIQAKTSNTLASQGLVVLAGTIAFNKAYTTAPVVILTPADAFTASEMQALQIYVTSSTTNFTLNFGTASTTRIPVSLTFNFNYFVIETQ
jgi:hypothetical protein